MIAFVGGIWLLTACLPAPASSSGLARPTPAEHTPTPASETDEEAIQMLLRAESEGVVEQNIEWLANLWAEDATIVDAKHTPDDDSDDAVWRGIDAILDRYVVLVFPGNPQFAEPEILELLVDGDTASVWSTTQIGDEVSPGGDKWVLDRRDGRWYIRSLTYNLESEKP